MEMDSVRLLQRILADFAVNAKIPMTSGTVSLYDVRGTCRGSSG
jgi:hypothetical protein